jgi:predicted tellurium resistance membrane protein TerC
MSGKRKIEVFTMVGILIILTTYHTLSNVMTEFSVWLPRGLSVLTAIGFGIALYGYNKKLAKNEELRGMKNES